MQIEVHSHGRYEGFGLALLHRDHTCDHLDKVDYDEPNLADSIAIGFDFSNPPPVPDPGAPNSEIFDARGNFYSRMECEVSLHMNGVERVNRVAPFDFRSLARPFRVDLEVEFEPAGAFVSVSVDEREVYSQQHLPLIAPYPWRLLAGARRFPFHAYAVGAEPSLRLQGITILSQPATELLPRFTTRIFGREPVDASHREVVAALPKLPTLGTTARVVLEFVLQLPLPDGDGWDRCASVSLTTPDGARVEVARLITPYKREWTWYFDITSCLPLIREGTLCTVFIDTWVSPAYLVTIDLHLCPPGRAAWAPRPLRVEPVWSGQATYGDGSGELAALVAARELRPPEGGHARCALHMVLTGHGFGDTSCNGAEFMPLVTVLRLSGRQVGRRVWWRDDCYLNPCRPQAGTWKFDRAGWAPGDAVRPWVVPLPGAGLLECEFAAYQNAGRARAYVWVSCYVTWLGEPDDQAPMAAS